MEGPSLVIAREEMLKAVGKKVLKVSGNSKRAIQLLKGQCLLELGTWGKHLLLFFTDFTIKVHFLMFGSYRVNIPKKNRPPRMLLTFKNIKIYFYSCAIQFLNDDANSIYDWSADIMSPSWDEKKALTKIQEQKNEMLGDILLDQTVFGGVGNIMKNEILFLCHLNPKRKVNSLNTNQLRRLIKVTHEYALNFYIWKKKFEFKKQWKITRKKICPHCLTKVVREITGRRKRLSHFCSVCQK